MGEIEIRSLRLEDTKEFLVYFLKAVKNSDTYNHQKMNKVKILKMFYSLVLDEDKCGYVAIKENKVIGLIAGFITTNWFSDDMILRELGIYVDEEYRNKSIAHKLFKKWFEFGAKYKVKEIVYGATADQKYFKPLYDLFTKKLNFSPMGIILRRR